MENSCNWPGTDLLMQKYHDEEWGVPLRDDQKLFEFLVLEGFQAGLSWSTVLKKREAFREVFKGFVPERVAVINEDEVQDILLDSRIIRNKMKIEASIHNAGCFLKIKEEFGSFSQYIWGFVDNHPKVNSFTKLSELPAKTPLSDFISADMKKRGFKFVGSTIIYAHMQATGMVNDHLVHCFRYNEINHSG
jgi:DNA-3-methyladenine glycosylase I